MSDFKMTCILCKDSTAADDDATHGFRTFSFANQDDDIKIAVCVFVCARHKDVVDMRHRFYHEVFQLREHDTGTVPETPEAVVP